METTIKIKECSTTSFTFTDFKYNDVTMFDDHIVHRGQFVGERINDNLGIPEEKTFDFHDFLFKDYIVGCGFTIFESEEAFQVIIYAAHPAMDMIFLFHKREEAIEFKNKIDNWLKQTA